MTAISHNISDRARRGRPLVEGARRLRIRDLRRPGFGFVAHELTASDGTVIRCRVEAGEAHGWIHVEHWPAGASWALSSYDVALVSREQPFGGRRWRFMCPEGFGPCSTLYLLAGGSRLASRQAHGLAFRSQRLTPADRAAARVRRIVADLGGAGSDMPARPKGMHAATYERHRAALARLAEAAAVRPA